jgi:hypothetical protein
VARAKVGDPFDCAALRSEFVIFSRAFSGQGRYNGFHENTNQEERV